MLERNAGASVRHLELHSTVRDACHQTYAAGRRELHGVREEVDDDLTDFLRIAAHDGARIVATEREREILFLGQRPNDDGRLFQERRQAELLDMHLLAPGLDAREAENVLDEHQQVLAARAYA